ncbi:hypothetical protein ACJX0J_011286 [Zea mays]
MPVFIQWSRRALPVAISVAEMDSGGFVSILYLCVAVDIHYAAQPISCETIRVGSACTASTMFFVAVLQNLGLVVVLVRAHHYRLDCVHYFTIGSHLVVLQLLNKHMITEIPHNCTLVAK